MKRLLLLPLLAATAFATGDYYEYSVPELPLYLGLDRLPKKTIIDIQREIQPPAVAPAVDFSKEVTGIFNALKAGQKPTECLPKVEILLVAERRRDKHNNDGLNAFLHDLRDLCASGAAAADAANYLSWRLAHGDLLGWSLTDSTPTPERSFGEGGKLDKTVEADIHRQTDAAPATTKAHWIYAHGAALYRLGNDAAAGDCFERVCSEFPKHPRAEVARYMVARGAFYDSREWANEELKSDPIKRGNAMTEFNDYLKDYPKGRFVGDALGWLGGLEYDAKHYGTALALFIKQLDVPEHPELVASATKEVERCLRHLADDPEGITAALTDARVAQAAVYLVANETETVEDQKYDEPATVTEWRKKVMPALAAALSKRADLFKEPGWQPHYVAALALAASANGDQTQALALLAHADAAASDDVAFARAVALQRAKRLEEAVDAFRFVLAKHPKSLLAPAARMRLGLTLLDAHRAGEAVLALATLAEIKAPTKDDEYYNNEIRRDRPGVEPGEPDQARQLIDTIFNFAPVAELAAALSDAPEVDRIRLRQVLAARHLAREQFTEAQQYMTPAQWQLSAAALAQLNADAKAAKTPAEKAATAMKLADAWAEQRGKLLTVPLDTEEWRLAVFQTEHPRANLRRLDNAAALGLKGGSVLDLENRDELRHAFNWWLTASDAQPGTPAAATAIWRALRSMRDIADVSPFTLDRAQTKKWPDTARKLYERLQKEHASSPEAKRLAVWWTFPAAKDDGGNWVGRWEASTRLKQVELTDSDDVPDAGLRALAIVSEHAPVPLATLRKKVTASRQWAQQTLLALPEQCLVNYFEDIDLFLTVPSLTPALAQRYIALRYDVLVTAAIGFHNFSERPHPDEKKDAPGTFRADEELLKEIRAAIADPMFAPAVDFVAFLELAVTANHWVSIPLKGTDKVGTPETTDKGDPSDAYWGRDYAGLERMTRAWLEKYPTSRKREAALLLHCRALRHAMQPFVFYKHASWPSGSRWEGEEKPLRIERLKFDAKVWKSELDRYDKEFPKGAYADDVLGYRADLAVRMADWKRALQITLAQCEGHEHLQPSAQDRLHELFSHLADEAERADLLAAIKASSGARAALREELGAERTESEHPLRWIRSWLLNQIQ